MAEIQIPAFDFSAIYYPQILEALLQYKRINIPELTDESPQEPLIQILRAFACVGHLNNTLADLIANETALPTAQLVGSVRNMLRLIDYNLSPSLPAQVTLLYELSQVLSTPIEVVPLFAQAATQATAAEPARYFEADEALTVQPTNALLAAFAIESGVATDVTAAANSAAAPTFTPWATPIGGSGGAGTGIEGDSLIFVHGEVMWAQLAVTLSTPGAGIVGVWEWFDGRYNKAKPTSVTMPGSALILNLNGYLGTAERTGTLVRVQLAGSGAYEEAFVEFSGGINRVTLTSFLGQTTPSLDVNDYIVGSAWNEFSNLQDGTANLTASGNVVYALPQNLTQDWEIGEHEDETGHWMRFRIIRVTAPTAPVFQQLRIDTGRQYVKRNAIQGRSHSDLNLGSSDGSPNQRFQGSREDFISGSDSVFVSSVQWTRVENFLSSRPTDRHYRVELGDNDQPTFIFGDGVTGAIPSAGVNNIRADYRYGADVNGNVGAGTINSDKAGLIYVNTVNNPRPATGWSAAEGSDKASLERAKIEGPASLRIKEVALGPDDVEDLAKIASKKFDSTLISISRARAIEEGFGPKTIELVIVPAGGALASTAQLAAVTTFFNGNSLASPPIKKRIVGNQEVTAVNYAPREIDVTVTVAGNVTSAQVRAALNRILQPEATKKDGVAFEWSFGGRVAMSRLESEIFAVSDSITDVDITELDVTLQARELPVVGTITITVVAPS